MRRTPVDHTNYTSNKLFPSVLSQNEWVRLRRIYGYRESGEIPLGRGTCNVDNQVQGVFLFLFLFFKARGNSHREGFGRKMKFQDQRNNLGTVVEIQEDHSEYWEWSYPLPFGALKNHFEPTAVSVFSWYVIFISYPNMRKPWKSTPSCMVMPRIPKVRGKKGEGVPNPSTDSLTPAEGEKHPMGGTTPRHAKCDSGKVNTAWN